MTREQGRPSGVERPSYEWLQRGKLYVLLTQEHCRISITDAAQQAIRGGADALQFREKSANDRQVLRLARELRRITANAGVGFIVNDRADIARLADADGVHLGQEDLPPAAARKVLGPGRIVGVSTHSISQARLAAAAGADYVGVGPIFPTATKGYETGLGTEHLLVATSAAAAPVVAIGGITADRVRQVLAAAPGRAVLLAVCSAILSAPDIEAATRAFKRAIADAEAPPETG